MACERDTYSVSVLNRVMTVYSLDHHDNKESAYFIKKPERDFVVDGSSSASEQIHDHVKSVSVYISSPIFRFGFSNNPWSLVFIRYLLRWTITSPCDFLGLLQNHAHWLMTYTMSGLVFLSRKFNLLTIEQKSKSWLYGLPFTSSMRMVVGCAGVSFLRLGLKFQRWIRFDLSDVVESRKYPVQ